MEANRYVCWHQAATWGRMAGLGLGASGPQPGFLHPAFRQMTLAATGTTHLPLDAGDMLDPYILRHADHEARGRSLLRAQNCSLSGCAQVTAARRVVPDAFGRLLALQEPAP